MLSEILSDPVLLDETKSGFIKCPVCSRTVFQSWNITDWSNVKTDWFLCYCGSIFQNGLSDKGCYDEKYVKGFKEQKQLEARMEWLECLYLPLIEEMTYGRRFLDVGFTVPLFIERLKKRGWLSDGIDLLPNNGYITGNFEDYDFKIQRYDLIRLNDVLSCFNDPVGAIRKVYKLLMPNGFLMLNTPDAEAIYLLRHPMEFGHWGRQHRVYISRRQLTKILKENKFDIILSWLNMADRLFSTNEVHILAQKPMVILDREEEKQDGKVDKPFVTQ